MKIRQRKEHYLSQSSRRAVTSSAVESPLGGHGNLHLVISSMQFLLTTSPSCTKFFTVVDCSFKICTTSLSSDIIWTSFSPLRLTTPPAWWSNAVSAFLLSSRIPTNLSNSSSNLFFLRAYAALIRPFCVLELRLWSLISLSISAVCAKVGRVE